MQRTFGLWGSLLLLIPLIVVSLMILVRFSINGIAEHLQNDLSNLSLPKPSALPNKKAALETGTNLVSKGVSILGKLLAGSGAILLALPVVVSTLIQKFRPTANKTTTPHHEPHFPEMDSYKEPIIDIPAPATAKVSPITKTVMPEPKPIITPPIPAPIIETPPIVERTPEPKPIVTPPIPAPIIETPPIVERTPEPKPIITQPLPFSIPLSSFSSKPPFPDLDEEQEEEEEFEEFEAEEEEESEEENAPSPMAWSPPVQESLPDDDYEPNADEETDDDLPILVAPMANNTLSPLPPMEILGLPEETGYVGPSREELTSTARLLEQKLEDFKIKGQIIDAHPGPVITTYELDPAPGLRAAKVVGLADDLARSISAVSVRVVGNIPGKNVIGIEIPNKNRRTVYLREILDSDAFRQVRSPLAMALGSDINGKPVVGNLAKMPHLLVAGTTGSGKSVAVNAMICSVLFTARPEEVRFLMVDPKMLELSIYEGIPHLLAPVVTDVNKAATLLKWAVGEMEDRYRLMAELGVRNLAGYNQRIQECLLSGEEPTRRVKVGFDPETGRPVEQEEPIPLDKKPLIVIIIDELADLMIQVGKDVEPAIARLAQMARAAGLHLIIATQRPSVDVITGLIKANFPTRLAFQVSSKIDSRTILDSMGADRLLGMGDGLFQPPGTTHLQRIHAPFVADSEVHKLVKFLKSTGRPEYDHSILSQALGEGGEEAGPGGGGMSEEYDPLYDQAVAVVIRARKVSTSMVQRHFRIGYNRAALIVERMALDGLISEPNHAGKREVLAPNAGDR
ncbi:MAG: cell division protein FtsK [Magnetococcales bacterium]|nr:cell division protein FtsK [Magnetococcales bacterium]MBF0437548.1 cell division protein FtsK [Magnetococcales bacterium]